MKLTVVMVVMVLLLNFSKSADLSFASKNLQIVFFLLLKRTERVAEELPRLMVMIVRSLIVNEEEGIQFPLYTTDLFLLC